MASELIFDISAVDLRAIAMDREAIMRWLPHRNHMLLLDGVVWNDDSLDHAIAVKHVRADEFWCDGHIPGYSLMPGVLMVEAGAQLSSIMYYRRSGMSWFAGFTRIEETAFRGQVLPGDDLYILCKRVRYSIKRFVSQVQGLVNGQIVFDSTITGMAFPNVLKGQRVIEGNTPPPQPAVRR